MKSEYKTGEVAKALGVNSKTILNWSDMYREFMSAGAKGEGQIQRTFTEQDRIVLNTIRVERTKGTDWEQIRARLAGNDFDVNLPPEAMEMNGAQAITIYAQVRALEAQLMVKDSEIERLLRDSKEKDAEIGRLNREIGELSAELRIIRRQLDDDTA